MDPGGRGGHPGRPPETLAKLSALRRGKTMSPESRRKISESLKGRKKTPEHLAKISTALIGHPVSPEVAAAIGAKNRGRKWTDAQRANLRDVRRAQREKRAASL